MRTNSLESIGGQPGRTPLNACIGGTLQQGSAPQLSTLGYIGGKK
ncbi:MAG TPA: hypothetical protein VGP62_17955 [Bryobacteraceae bacterium]|nr:hypothetical protein [Bryobacteraceae bacterium]